jgi:hypothetical protein
MNRKQQTRYAKSVVQTARFFVERFDNRMLGERFNRLPLWIRFAVLATLALLGAVSTKFVLLLLRGMR